MADSIPALPIDLRGHPVPVLRPTIAIVELSVDAGGVVVDIGDGTKIQIISLICISNQGLYILGDDSLDPNMTIHFIGEEERLVFSTGIGDTKLAVSALATGTADFYITILS